MRTKSGEVTKVRENTLSSEDKEGWWETVPEYLCSKTNWKYRSTLIGEKGISKN